MINRKKGQRGSIFCDNRINYDCMPPGISAALDVKVAGVQAIDPRRAYGGLVESGDADLRVACFFGIRNLCSVRHPACSVCLHAATPERGESARQAHAGDGSAVLISPRFPIAPAPHLPRRFTAAADSVALPAAARSAAGAAASPASFPVECAIRRCRKDCGWAPGAAAPAG